MIGVPGPECRGPSPSVPWGLRPLRKEEGRTEQRRRSCLPATLRAIRARRDFFQQSVSLERCYVRRNGRERVFVSITRDAAMWDAASSLLWAEHVGATWQG